MYLLLIKNISEKISKFYSSSRQGVFLIGTVIGLLLVLVAHLIIDALYVPPNCYLDKVWNDSLTLLDINDDVYLNSRSSYKNVFFHETSCIEDGVIKLNARQACAIESTARTNPDHNIYVLFTSQVGYRNKTALPLIDALHSYPNVHINYLNITKYAEDTPLQEWIKTDKLYRSRYVVSHTSDVLRFLSMWKYGGTYLDLDVVMLRSLNTIEYKNYAAAESDNTVAVGIIHFEGRDGHKITDMCLRDLEKNFSTKKWAENGPFLLTRTLKKLCDTPIKKMIEGKVCANFRVLPVESCYKITWYDRIKFFEQQYIDEVMEAISDSLMTHVWNKSSAEIPLRKDSEAPYIHIARKYCPNVLEASEDF